jgi:SPP1 gp7 family putative phage head morphogenesis protein
MSIDNRVSTRPVEKFRGTPVTRADSTLYDPYLLRPYNPDSLYQKRQDYELFDEMREDDQIAALLTLKKFLILNKKWELETSTDKIKEFIEYMFEECLDEIFDIDLYNILSAIDYGFSISEKIFISKPTPFGEKIVLNKLKTRPPHTFEFDQDDYGNIIRIRQDTSSGHDIKIPPEKVIHYLYQKEFDNPYGKSELNLGVYRAWWSKNAIIKFWNIYLERYGSPTVVGKYPDDKSQLRSDLKTILKNLQAKTAIVVPEGVNLELLTSGGKTGESEYEKAIDKYDIMIARKMLIPDLMGFSGSKTGGGSYALGDKQFDMFYNNIKYEEKKLINVVNKEILAPIILWNFGPNDYAKFIPSQVDEAQKQEDIKLWIEAIKTGKVPVTDNQLNWFYQMVNAPEIDKKELAEIKEEKEKLKEQFEQTPKKEEENKTEVPKKKEELTIDKEAKEYADRKQTKYEKNANVTAIAKELDKLEDNYDQELGIIYKTIINALITDIKQKKIIEKRRFEAVNKLELRYQGQSLKINKDMHRESYLAGDKSSLKKFVEGFVLDNEEVAAWLENSAIYTNTAEADTILKKAKGTLTEAIRDGLGVAETEKLIRKALKGWDVSITTKAGKKTGGNRIETLVRTVINKSFNEARKQKFEKIGEEIAAYQFSAILDGRTSDICTKLDGKIIPKEDASYYWPPLHFNCRSLMVPVFNEEVKGDLELSKLPKTEIEPGGFLKLA